MKIQFATDIRCSPKNLWPWLTETERMKQWMKGLLSVEPSEPGPPRAGSTARMTIKEGGRAAVYDSKILSWEPERRLEIALSSPQWKVGMRCEYRLEDLAGSTRLHYGMGCDTSRTLYKILGALFGWVAKLQAKSFMKALKRCAESDGARVRSATAA